jgi:hypothetical protein
LTVRTARSTPSSRWPVRDPINYLRSDGSSPRGVSKTAIDLVSMQFVLRSHVRRA